MVASSKLIVATSSDVEATTRKQLSKGVLKSNFLSGPPFSLIEAGFQPLGSGLHYNRRAPILVQFPPEILSNILSSLEPIWLFQAEAAYPEVNGFLNTSQGNKIWYEALPPALFVEADAFQDEKQLAQAKRERGYEGLLTQSPKNPFHGSEKLSNDAYFYPQVAEAGFIVLPPMTGLSEISYRIDWTCDVRHTKEIQYYPFVSSHGKVRVRNLAIGGPFQPSLKYRRELLGHLHYGKRCNMCFEVLTDGSHFRSYKRDWGMIWCEPCLAAWTVSPQQFSLIHGLGKIAKATVKASCLASRARASSENQWLPLVDDIVRRAIGLEFGTATAKQGYIHQILKTLNTRSRPIDISRVLLRHKIVKRVQQLWDSGTVGVISTKFVDHFRNTFPEPHAVSKFLFAAHDLSTTPCYKPRDQSYVWLSDPTMELKSNTKVISRSDKWVTDQAMTMIRTLLRERKVTTLVKMADACHVRRIKRTMTADYALGELRKHKTLSYNQRYDRPDTPRHLRRLEVILNKLHLDVFPNQRLPVLSEHETQVAKDHFGKIVFAACIGCPFTSLLALPRGIEGVVKHFRDCHSKRYWQDDDWMIVG